MRTNAVKLFVGLCLGSFCALPLRGYAQQSPQSCVLTNVTIPRGDLLCFLGYVGRLAEVQGNPKCGKILVDVRLPLVFLPQQVGSASDADAMRKWCNERVSSLHADDDTIVPWRAAQGPWTFASVSWGELLDLAHDVFGCRIDRKDGRVVVRLFPPKLELRSFRFDPHKHGSAANVLMAAYGGDLGPQAYTWVFEDTKKNTVAILAVPSAHTAAADVLKDEAFSRLF